MSKFWNLVTEQSLQYIIFLMLSAIILLLTAIAYHLNGESFQRFFGKFNPLLVVFIVFIIGLIVFTLLLNDGQFAIYRKGNFQGILLAVGLAIPFAIVIILFDRWVPFPADTNVPYPESLAFYPVMGYVVQILFFILPFSLLYFLLAALPVKLSTNSIIWISMLIVALIEPVFQVTFPGGQKSVWALLFVGGHIFLICLVQLLLFRHYDFISMYSFRLAYYFLWHILWGHLRLNVLFGL